MPSIAAVRLDLTTRLSKDAQAQVVGLLTNLGLARERWPTRLHSSLTIAAGYRRVDFKGASPLGTNVSMVTRPQGGLWIQHDAKVFVPIDRPERAKKAPAHQADGTAQKSKPPEPCLTVIDRQSGRSIRITATPNPEWRAPDLARQAVLALLGGPEGELPAGFDGDHWARLFAVEGFPSQIRFEALDQRGEPIETLSTVTVTAFSHQAIEPKAFAAPTGYRKWRLQKPTPARADEKPRGGRADKPTPGYTSMPPRPMAGSSNEVGVSRQALDDDGPNRDDPPPRPPRPPRPPQPPASTTQPRIGFRLEQRLLNQISGLFNTVVTPIRTFTVGQGRIVFDWLDQLRNDVVRRGANAAGTAVYQLLHDVSLPPTRVIPAPTPASDFGSFMCRGILDQIAIRDAESLFRLGTYPQTTILTFPPTMRTVISTAGTNWDLLPDGVKARLTFELVRRKYGVISRTFPTSTPPGGALGLINFRVSGITGGLTLPPAPAPVMGDPPFNPLLSLTAGTGGSITGMLSLGTLAVNARVDRWPTATFFLLLAGAGIVAAFFPALAWALGLVAGLALLFSFDLVLASLTATGLSASIAVDFVQDAEGVFVPVARCSVGGMVRFNWASQVPTGIHQILAAIEETTVNLLIPPTLRLLESIASDLVTGAIRAALGRGFPASALRLNLPISGGLKGGRAGVYTYLEAQLDPQRDPRFAIPTVATPASLETAQNADVARAQPVLGADHYVSLSFDQNFLNVFLAGLRRQAAFDGAWLAGSSAALKPLMPPPIPKSTIGDVHLMVESGPTMVLASSVGGPPPNHGALQFGYLVSMGTTAHKPAVRIQFRVDVAGDLVLGQVDRATGLIPIQAVALRAFDLLLRPNGAVITPTAFDIVTVTEVRTVSTDFDDRGKPRRVVEIDFLETNSPVPLTPAMIQSLDPLLRQMVAEAWWFRDPNRAPRGDGAAPGVTGPLPVDPVTRFRYPLGDLDPDLLDTESHLRAELGLERQLAHFHAGLAGLVTTAFLPLRAGSMAPILAAFSSANSTAGILAAVKVQASTTSSRSLSL